MRPYPILILAEGLILAAGLAACAQVTRRVEEVRPLGRVAASLATSDWDVMGASVEGRPIHAATFGSGPVRVYVIAGIHGDEKPAVANAERLRVLLLGQPPETSSVRLVRDVNPDGTAHGTRTNVRGVDLNRNWPASNFRPSASRGATPLSEPETTAILVDMRRFQPQLVIALHAARAGPFVNFDGPGLEPARTFVDAAAEHDSRWKIRTEMGYATPGSLGSLMGMDRGIPVLTIELDRAQSGDEAWPSLRAGIAAVLAELHLPEPPAAADADGTLTYDVR